MKEALVYGSKENIDNNLRSRKLSVTTMKIKSDRVTFVLVATGIVCTIIAAMGLLYVAFEVSRLSCETTFSQSLPSEVFA